MPIGRTRVPATDARSADLRAGEWRVLQRGYSMLVGEGISIDFKSQCHGFIGLVDVGMVMDAEVGLAVHFCALSMFYADQVDWGSEERRVGEEGRFRWSPDYLKKKKNEIVVLVSSEETRNGRFTMVSLGMESVKSSFR